MGKPLTWGQYLTCGRARGSLYVSPILEETMTIYIALFNLTEAGIKTAKDSPPWAAR